MGVTSPRNHTLTVFARILSRFFVLCDTYRRHVHRRSARSARGPSEHDGQDRRGHRQGEDFREDEDEDSDWISMGLRKRLLMSLSKGFTVKFTLTSEQPFLDLTLSTSPRSLRPRLSTRRERRLPP